jgi:hypothetical protein
MLSCLCHDRYCSRDFISGRYEILKSFQGFRVESRDYLGSLDIYIARAICSLIPN